MHYENLNSVFHNSVQKAHLLKRSWKKNTFSFCASLTSDKHMATHIWTLHFEWHISRIVLWICWYFAK